jgi:hypothetical protein
MAIEGLEGRWASSYVYGEEPGGQPLTSEHIIVFDQKFGDWVGTSEAVEEGSRVVMTLTQSGNEYQGPWRERTSPIGAYKGREFTGRIHLVISEDQMVLNGIWTGVSRSGRVKAGKWTLRRLEVGAKDMTDGAE